MRTLLVLIGVVALVLLAAMMLGFVRFDQTQTAQLPRLEGGQTPKFDADVAKVSVGTDKKTVEVPAISVEKPANQQ
ncbi:hypothetical protein [Sphingomonas adhaesiva]|uniref:hypothetical protein n=1 Tax=Sphingomonas adhaesiva TaxID=28212 RepID=UPI002FF86BF0